MLVALPSREHQSNKYVADHQTGQTNQQPQRCQHYRFLVGNPTSQLKCPVLCIFCMAMHLYVLFVWLEFKAAYTGADLDIPGSRLKSV